MGNEITLTADNFKSEVLQADMPVVVDFWAEWCMPCRMVAPVLEDLSQKYDGKIRVGKLNIDHHNDLAIKYNITSIPALIVFKHGKVHKQHIGAASKNTLEGMITASL